MADFKSWLPTAIAAIVVLLLYHAISGRWGEFLSGQPASLTPDRFLAITSQCFTVLFWSGVGSNP